MIFTIVLAAVGVYSIITGVKIILTGSLSAREEAKLKDYSEKGARIYKLSYAITSIVGSFVIFGLAAIYFLEEQKIIEKSLIIRLVLLAVAIVITVALAIIRSRCKKMTDE